MTPTPTATLTHQPVQTSIQENTAAELNGQTWKQVVKYDLSLFFSVVLKNINDFLSSIYLQNSMPKAIKVRDWSNKIKSKDENGNEIDHKIILGGIPLKNLNLIDEISSQAQAILSMIENFEIDRNTWFSTPVTQSEWAKNGTSQLQLETPDFKPVTAKMLGEGVRYLSEQIKKENTVYVHCKAGVGRSAAVVISYLAKKFMDKNSSLSPEDAFDKAYNIVKDCRPVIHVVGKEEEILNYLKAPMLNAPTDE